MNSELLTLAQTALQQYGIANARLKRINDTENALFRVDTDQRYTLRVYHPDTGTGYLNLLSDAALHSELVWLRSLHSIGLGVPEPLPAQDGALIIRAHTPQMPDGRRCALFRWVEGRFRDKSLTPTALEQVGAFLARMHNHAESFIPPEGFWRYRWDWEREFGTQAPLMTEQANLLSPERRALFRSMGLVVRQSMDALGESPANFGLIHSDLHEENYLFHGKEVRAIDFAECGWGYYLFDLAVALYFLRNRPNFADLQAAALRGYQQQRALPADVEKHLHAFYVMRAIDLTNYVLDEDGLRTDADCPRWLDSFEQAIRRFSGK